MLWLWLFLSLLKVILTIHYRCDISVSGSCGGLEGVSRFQLNLAKIEWLWLFGPSGSGNLLFLMLDGVALLESVLNLGSFCAHSSYSKSSITVIWRAFAQFLLLNLRQFLDQEALQSITHALVNSPMNYCNVLYMWLLLKSIQKLQLR